MMSYGYEPQLSEGSVKVPIFQTSTFVFKTAEEGKAFYRASSLDWRRAAIAAGQDEAAAHEAAKRTYAFYTAGGDLL